MALIGDKNEYVMNIVANVRGWIKSWFDYILSEEEFHLSYKLLESYMSNNRLILDGYFYHAIRELLKSLLSDIDKFGNYLFFYRTTLGFIGSSIVEGKNQSLKFGDYKCRVSMGIDKSSETQLRLAVHDDKKRNITISQDITRTITWSRSLTSSFLTSYMEGVSIKNFDMKSKYAVVYANHGVWHVMRKEISDRFEYCGENNTSFKCSSNR